MDIISNMLLISLDNFNSCMSSCISSFLTSILVIDILISLFYLIHCFLQALEMVSDRSNSTMPFLFLITDGAVENERDICNVVKDYCAERSGLDFPRISTFGLGKYLFLVSFVQKERWKFQVSKNENLNCLALRALGARMMVFAVRLLANLTCCTKTAN